MAEDKAENLVTFRRASFFALGQDCFSNFRLLFYLYQHLTPLGKTIIEQCFI